jgi:hypothetical protein
MTSLMEALCWKFEKGISSENLKSAVRCEKFVFPKFGEKFNFVELKVFPRYWQNFPKKSWIILIKVFLARKFRNNRHCMTCIIFNKGWTRTCSYLHLHKQGWTQWSSKTFCFSKHSSLILRTTMMAYFRSETTKFKLNSVAKSTVISPLGHFWPPLK